MDKPERVEAGQWWCWKETPEDDASTDTFRITFDHCDPPFVVGALAPIAPPFGEYHYLGSGDHPEPSEWMIETLAKHAWDSRGDDMHWSEIGIAFQDKMRADVRRLIAGSDCDPFEWNATVISLYRILRSLGKW